MEPGAGAARSVPVKGDQWCRAAAWQTMFPMTCHTAINKLGLPAELSNVAEHGALVPFPAFGSRVESALDMVLPGMVLDTP